MKIVYLFCVYKNPHLLRHTIQRLDAPDVSFYVHVDKASQADFSALSGIDNVHIAEKQFVTNWGGVIYAIINCLADIRARRMGDFVILMSESDYPVKSSRYIGDYLRRHVKDYIIATPLPHPNPLHTPDGKWVEGGRRRLECYPVRLTAKSIASIEPRRCNFGNARQFVKVLRDNPRKFGEALRVFFRYPTRRHPPYLRPCGGELWFGLRMTTVEQILDFCAAHPDFLEYHQDTIVSDEIVFPTLVHHLVEPAEREDSTLRYISWPRGGAFSPLDLSLNDKELLARCVSNPDCLFVRKVQEVAVCEQVDEMVDSDDTSLLRQVFP